MAAVKKAPKEATALQKTKRMSKAKAPAVVAEASEVMVSDLAANLRRHAMRLLRGCGDE